MTLAIELSPEVNKRLEAEAERHGQTAVDYVRHMIEEAIDPYRGLVRRTPEEVQRLLDEQGVKPVTDPNQLLGDFWPEDESVDDFMAARKEWAKEGGPGFPFDDPDECPRDLA